MKRPGKSVSRRTDPTPRPILPPRRIAERIAVSLIVLAALLLLLRGLGHSYLTYYDEAFHAIVARNLLEHPLRPTLNDPAWLPYDYRDWTENHVWLHKGILPLWQIAASYAVLGVNGLGLRMPSALLATAGVYLTYLIGRRLVDGRAALIAAGLQAINSFLAWMVHGYWFSDHVDIALLFWVELGMYCMIRGLQSDGWRWPVAAGVCQGLAFLCKTYPALIVQAVGVAAYVLLRMGFGRRATAAAPLRAVLLMLLATLGTIAPWTSWCILKYPREFFHEMGHVGRHLYTDVESWGAPWDRLIFDYAILIYFVFFTPILVAAVILLRPALRRRSLRLGLLYAWGFGVFAPFLLAESKTPSSIVIGMPPLLLLLGTLISRALRGNRRALAAWFLIVLFSVAWPVGPREAGHGYPDPPVFAGIMRKELWVFWHVLGTLVAAFLAGRAAGPLGHWQAWRSRWRPGLIFVGNTAAALGTLFLAGRMIHSQWQVGSPHPDQPSYAEISRFVRGRLPNNAALIVDRRYVGEHKVIQWSADRTCYGLEGNWRETADQLRRAGAIPYLLSCRRTDLPIIYRAPTEGWIVYAFPPRADDLPVAASRPSPAS